MGEEDGRTGVLGLLAFGFRCCPKGPTYQGSAPRTEGACGDTQVPGEHPSPTAVSRAGPTSDHEGGTGECRWEGRSPGWALISHSLFAQGLWQSLTIVFTILKEGLDPEHTAVLHMGPFTPTGGSGVLWGHTAWWTGEHEARGEIQGQWKAAPISVRTTPPLFTRTGGWPTRASHNGPDPTAKTTTQSRVQVWAWQESATWGFGGHWAKLQAGEAQAVLLQLGVGIVGAH